LLNYRFVQFLYIKNLISYLVWQIIDKLEFTVNYNSKIINLLFWTKKIRLPSSDKKIFLQDSLFILELSKPTRLFYTFLHSTSIKLSLIARKYFT
jgi:hypothetical protein